MPGDHSRYVPRVGFCRTRTRWLCESRRCRIDILDLVEYETLIGQRIDSSKIEKVIGRWTAHDRHKALFLSFPETIGKSTA